MFNGSLLKYLIPLWLLVLPSLSLCQPVSSISKRVALVEAGFITKFPLFVEWPKGVLPDADKPIVISILGKSDILEPLVEVASLKNSESRGAIVRRVSDLNDIKGSHILFIAASERNKLNQVLSAVSEQPILTVSDDTGFGKRGTMINFFVEGSRVRFELNLPAIHRAGLKVSYRLEQVAEDATRNP